MPNVQQGVDGIVVGVADLGVGAAADGRLLTFALGSCMGVSAYDPTLRIGGLLHFMLPQPGDDAPAAAAPRLAMYATSGLPELFRRLAELGARRDRLVVCAAGAAEVAGDDAVSAVGKRNKTMLRKVFWKSGTRLWAEDTGGTVARTMWLDLGSGEVRVRSREGEKVLWAPAPAPRPAAGSTPSI